MICDTRLTVVELLLGADRKLVIIGDGACGKTSLLSVFTLGYFPTVSFVFFEYANQWLEANPTPLTS